MIYDISPLLHDNSSVWPGEELLQTPRVSGMRTGQSSNIHSMRTSCHLGAHANAPSFLDARGATIEQMPLGHFLGVCQLIRLKAQPRSVLELSDLQERAIQAPRLLIDTGTYNSDGPFRVDYASLSVELVEYLALKGVQTIGVDVPTLDPYRSSDWSAHRACIAKNIAVLEGLLLWKVPEGSYQLIALPLKLSGCEASPVRAILTTTATKSVAS